jgi:hypothetical protein
MRNHGIPYPDILVWGAIALDEGAPDRGQGGGAPVGLREC